MGGAELNRCRIGRLTLGEEDKERLEVPDKDSTEREEETVTKEWEVGRANVRRAQELRDIRASKRLGQGVPEEESNASPSSVKKMRLK